MSLLCMQCITLKAIGDGKGDCHQLFADQINNIAAYSLGCLTFQIKEDLKCYNSLCFSATRVILTQHNFLLLGDKQTRWD